MHPDPKFRLRRSVEDAYCIAGFLHGTILCSTQLCVLFLIHPLANLGFAHEDIRIVTDEGHPWNPPTKENIVSPPYEMSLLHLHFIQLREMRSLVRNALPHDSFVFYCA